jgi:hypothetical protein
MSLFDRLYMQPVGWIKAAERQEVRPLSAGLAGLLPFGGLIHGAVAGNSAKEGIREEVGQVAGNIPGTIAGGVVGAGILGRQQYNKELNRGLGIREGILERAKVLSPEEAERVGIESLAAARLRGALRGLSSMTRGARRGGLVGGALTGAVGTALAARGGNRVVQADRIEHSPILSRVQDWLTQQSQKSAMTKQALNAWERRFVDGRLSPDSVSRITGLSYSQLANRTLPYLDKINQDKGTIGRKGMDLINLARHHNYWSSIRNLVRTAGGGGGEHRVGGGEPTEEFL